MKNRSNIVKGIKSILVIGILFGLVSCRQKGTVRIEAAESPETVEGSSAENGEEEALKDRWTFEEAEKYYDELTEKVKMIEGFPRGGVVYDSSLEGFRYYLSALGVDSIKGLEKELACSSDAKKTVTNCETYEERILTDSDASDMEREIESIDSIINDPYLRNQYNRLMKPVLTPDAYLRIETKKKSLIIYFKDIRGTAIIVEYEGNGLSRIPVRFIINRVYKPWEEQSWGRYLHDDSNKCIIKNCSTGETAEFELVPHKDLQAVYEKARNLAADLNVEERKLAVYQGVKNIMKLTGKDLKEAKQVYEDICWGIWMNVKSIDSYDPNSQMVVFQGVDDEVYEGHLNSFGDIDEIHQQCGEAVYNAPIEELPSGKREMSLVDLKKIYDIY